MGRSELADGARQKLTIVAKGSNLAACSTGKSPGLAPFSSC
jgi:hypothetical protein